MKPRRLRLLAAVALGSATFLLAGCVYLRLLAMKHQLADFDRHFTLQQDQGLRLLCRDPVLLAKDFLWLGVVPESKRKLGHAEQWRVRWEKELPAGVRDPEPRDLEVELVFADDAFAQAFMPERYFVFVPKAFFIGLLRGLGSASIDRAKREADVSFSAEERARVVEHVTMTSIESLLGYPSERSVSDGQTTFRYRYETVPTGSKGGFIDMRFTFTTSTGQLVRLQGKSPVGNLAFNFAPAP